jgi:hypothetical protein
MKTCVLFGNCHCSGIRKFLEFSNFYEKYEVHQFANWELLKNNDFCMPINLIKNADLVIYQPLSDVYGCYSTNKKNEESFFNLLKEDCKSVSFPRIHNNAIFPIFRKARNNNIIYGKYKNSIETENDLIYKYKNNMIDFDFDNRISQNYYISKQKEANCDIQIADFLYSNISKHKLFLTQDHPTSFVFNELTSRLCNILDLDYNYDDAANAEENFTKLEDSVYGRNDCQYPISRYSIQHFNFEYIKQEHPDANEFYLKNLLEYYYV